MGDHTGRPATRSVASNAAANASIHNPANPVYNFQSGLYAFVTELFELLLSPVLMDVAGVDHATEDAIVEVILMVESYSNPVGEWL